MRGNEFIRQLLTVAGEAASDANSAGFMLGEMIGQGFKPINERPVDTRTIGDAEIPLRERQPGEESGRPRPQAGPMAALPAPNDATDRATSRDAPANVRMMNGGATRNLPVNDGLAANIGNAIESVYGPGFEARIYSGGQPSAGKGMRTGSVRHDGGRAADLYIYGPDGQRLTGDALAPMAQFWKANRLGGVGLEMQGGGIHLDDWVEPPKGGGMSWSYGELTAAQRAALEEGARGNLPPLVQEWAGAVVGEGNDATAKNVYNSLSGALTPTLSTSGSGGMTSQESKQIEELIGGMISDAYGDETGDEERARMHKASIFENLSVSLGQMAQGKPVDVSGVLRAQEEAQIGITARRMDQHRMRAGAQAVIESGGSPAMAQAVATGAVSYRDMLTERQLASTEAQLMRQNAQDDQRRDAMANLLQSRGYAQEMIDLALTMDDPTAVLRVQDMMDASDAAELAAEKARVADEGRRAIMNDLANSTDPTERRAAFYMADNPQLTVADAMKASQEHTKRADEEIERQAGRVESEFEAAQRRAERMATETWANQTRQVVQAGEADPVQKRALELYDLSGRTMSVLEAQSQATAELDDDAVVVGAGGTLVRRATGEVVHSNEAAGTARLQEYRMARQEAEAAGTLDEFNARFPTVVEYSLEYANRRGGLEDRGLDEFIVPLTGGADSAASVSSDFDPTSAFGVPGFVTNLQNTLSEIMTGQLSDAQQRRATTQLNRLATRTLIQNAESVAGRAPVYLLQLFEQLETRPNRPLTGPETARLQFQDQLRAIEIIIAENNAILGGRGFDDSERQKAAMGNMRLQTLQKDFQSVLQAFDRAGIGEVRADEPEAAAREPLPEEVRAGPNFSILEEAAASHGGLITVEDVWATLSEADRAAFLRGE